MYASDMVVYGLVDIVLTNGTGTIAGGPVVSKIRDFNRIQSQVQVFIDTYQNDDGSYDSQEYYYLFGVSCNDSIIVEMGSTREFCYSLDPRGKIGLLNINLILYKEVENYIEDFLSSERTANDTEIFFYRQWDKIQLIGFIQYMFASRLLGLGATKFSDRVETDNQALLNLAISVSIINVLLSLLAIPMVLYKLLTIDFSLKKMFMLVPTHVIVKNRWLKFYLMKTAGKMSKNVERAL